MPLFRSRDLMIVIAAAALSVAAATDVSGAVRARHRGHAAGRRGGFAGPMTTRPATPPVFNPASPYTMPQAPETPVSPASPGSVFGN